MPLFSKIKNIFFQIQKCIFLYRYIPVGVLERPPQKINERPPHYHGRNELETLLSSASCGDWIKIRWCFILHLSVKLYCLQIYWKAYTRYLTTNFSFLNGLLLQSFFFARCHILKESVIFLQSQFREIIQIKTKCTIFFSIF